MQKEFRNSQIFPKDCNVIFCRTLSTLFDEMGAHKTAVSKGVCTTQK